MESVKKKKPRKKRKRKSRYQRGEYTSTKTGQICRYRSGWEHRYMLHLDSDPEVETWTYEQTVIAYVSNIRTKKVRRYYPDFFVKYRDGRTEVVEVKPKRKLAQATVLKKAAAAQQWCLENGSSYRMITEVELKAMGLL
jgi:TnsA endonuclease N terminal